MVTTAANLQSGLIQYSSQDGTKSTLTSASPLLRVDSQTMRDLEGAALYLKNHPHANGKVGIIGFCSRGRDTLMFGCTSQNVDAAVDSAGGHPIPDELTTARPVAAIDMVSDLECPLLALFGEEDTNPSSAHAGQLIEELDKHDKTYKRRMYPNAGYAFFADYRLS